MNIGHGREEITEYKRAFSFMIFVLAVYDRNMNNIVDQIGEKTKTNRVLSRILGPTFVGCHIHRFNWAVKDTLEEKKELIEQIKQQ